MNDQEIKELIEKIQPQLRESWAKFKKEAIEHNRMAAQANLEIANTIGATANALKGQIALAVIAGWVAMFVANSSGNFWTLLFAFLALLVNQWHLESAFRTSARMSEELQASVDKSDVPSGPTTPERQGKLQFEEKLDWMAYISLGLSILLFLNDVGVLGYTCKLFIH